MIYMEDGVVEKVITPHDRCDQCRSQAYFVAFFESGELYFCRHHFYKNEESLRDSAYYIIDQSEDLEG